MNKLTEVLGTELGPIAAIAFVVVGYVLITVDRTRAASVSKDDTQVGLKLVLFGLVIAGVQLAAQGVAMFLGFALGGFKGGSSVAKVSIPPIIVGALVVLGVTKALLPRTNTATFRQAERYMLGALALQFGVMAIVSLDGMLTDLFTDAPWVSTAASFAGAVVDGVVALFALMRFGALAGWTMPVAPVPPPPMAPPPQYPPQGGGYPPPGGYGGTPPPSGYGPPGGGGGYGPPTGGNPYAPR